MEMVGHALDADVPFDRKMRDRDQDRVFDAGEPDRLRMAGANLLMPCQKTQQPMNELAKLAIASPDQEFGTRDRERRARTVDLARMIHRRACGGFPRRC